MAKSKYETQVLPKLNLVKGWAREGLTDVQIANKLGITESTFYKYKQKYSEFSESLKESKEEADVNVETALYQAAINGNITAMIFWLKNRCPKQWREKPEPKEDENKAATIEVVWEDASVEGDDET